MKARGSTLRKGKSLPNGESSSQMRGEEGVPKGQPSPTWSSLSGDENRVSVPTEILRYEEEAHEGQTSPLFAPLDSEQYQVPALTERLRQEEFEHDYWHFTNQHSFVLSLKLIQRSLEERRGMERQGGRSSSTCIFPFPHSLDRINPNTYQPELVSIGPYHRGKAHVVEFEDRKWLFLDKFLSRSNRGLSYYLGAMRQEEKSTRDCYSETIPMSSHDFVEMMLLDSCFVLELLRNLNHGEDTIIENDPIYTRP
ncbi:unnamed protein product [Dovyalis caffra]|uniref:Uncharacterized protein n=1 Tax=Dovyalis caffra TaxID=77055 RepID=A0AAV1R7B8_9ROSI|nr:unnamed protein product [Dovyalis caffra]